MSSGPDEALAAHELDLVSRAAKGDSAAFDRFFERNAPAVQLLIERLLGPGEVADGVVLEAFEKTVRRLPLLGARNSSPALYVLSTARNGAYAALGRGRPTAEGGPLAALLALPSRQRELLALRELGLPEADCAEVAGIDASEVGVQVARARLRLTDELEGLTLSTVFADDRAERLLAAEVVRVEGQPVPDGLAEEISSHADQDSRFAAALSAVRSPSRSVGQLPPVSGPARLAAAARTQAVVGGTASGSTTAPGAGAVAAGAIAGAAGAAVAAGAGQADPGVVSGPRSIPRSTSDPYDEDIGDEMAWGIVDDEDDGAFQAPAAQTGAPAVERPTDGQWEDGAGAISEEPTRVTGPPAASVPPAPAPHGAPEGTDPSLTDPFAGWDDALDWDEDEKEWAAGSAGVAAAGSVDPAPGAPDLAKHDAAAASGAPAEENTIAAAAAGVPIAGAAASAPITPHAPVDLGETRAFDAVAAGLVDPEPMPVSDFDHGDDAAGSGGGGSKWRWIGWMFALLLLFAGFAFAAYAWQSANQDPDLPPTSRLDDTTPAQVESTTPKATTPKKSTSTSSSSKSSSDEAKSTTSGSSSSSSSTGASGSTTSGSSGSTSTSSGTSGSSGTSSKPSSRTAAPADDTQVVSPGESSSGGAVRGSGEEATGGTTP